MTTQGIAGGTHASPLLRLSPDRIEAELRRVRQAEVDDAFYRRRRNGAIAIGTALWACGMAIVGGAFHTGNMALGSALLLLGPIVGTFGPLVVAYAYWSMTGES